MITCVIPFSRVWFEVAQIISSLVIRHCRTSDSLLWNPALLTKETVMLYVTLSCSPDTVPVVAFVAIFFADSLSAEYTWIVCSLI